MTRKNAQPNPYALLHALTRWCEGLANQLAAVEQVVDDVHSPLHLAIETVYGGGKAEQVALSLREAIEGLDAAKLQGKPLDTDKFLAELERMRKGGAAS